MSNTASEQLEQPKSRLKAKERRARDQARNSHDKRGHKKLGPPFIRTTEAKKT